MMSRSFFFSIIIGDFIDSFIIPLQIDFLIFSNSSGLIVLSNSNIVMLSFLI